ncbi:TetR/AcrR family transcriptional regulator [Streptacidiphilus sp. PAMC 29251]
MSEQGHAIPVRGETYAGQSRHEREAERRARITEAAVQLFAARDYDDVTVADVCVRAKLSKRYFYEVFSDRLELLLTVHRELNDWLLDGITAAAPKQPADLRQLLSAMMEALVRMLFEHPERARVIYINAPRMELRRRGLLRKDAELFGRLARRSLDKPRDRIRHDRMLLALTAGITEVVIDWLQRGMTDSPQELADHLTGLCLAILGDGKE